ncbi:EpsG family protein [Lachnospiraceae bacterium NE2001]|nr:EpsG family protein [Lachnospiraceae bacterium NE2001]
MEYIAYSLIYYIMFLLAGTFFSAADRSLNDKKTRRWIFLGILLLSIFAGLRAISVGTDTSAVVHYRFDNARLYSSWRAIMTPGNEPFLTLIGYIIKKTFNDYRIYLFVLQLLFEIPIGIVAYKLRNRITIAGFMTVFMLMFYQVSLNIHKQSIAAAWLLLAVVYFREKKIFQAVILAAISTLFHGSVFIGIGLFAVIYVLCTSKSKSIRFLAVVITAIIAIFAFLNWRTVANIILSSDSLTDDYTNYISIAAGESGARYTSFHYKTYISIVLRFVGALLIGNAYLKSEKRSDPDVRFYLYSTIIGFLIYSVFIIAFRMYIGDRMTLYLDICQMVLISLLIGKPSVYEISKRKRHTIRIITSGPSLYLWFCFAYNFIYLMIVNYGKTLPYFWG